MQLLTYQLMESNLVRVQEIRKSLSSTAAAPSKCFYMFYVDLDQAARIVLEMCYKAVANLVTRRAADAETNHRLLERHARVEAMADNVRAEAAEAEEPAEDLDEQISDIMDMVTRHFIPSRTPSRSPSSCSCPRPTGSRCGS